ncbi:hypothetical protein AYL99_00052 [Fonsecaea erecta]|uniref:Uncharacterized protein n=1 Tax=Fonsecaea erecta TaxID=1367422 RepID=A0A178ZW91_9EURO|nr:hypothetical protein AYL99_00052 [Fonsecaea erecta]OAP64080.1 hypothetical protein AYL99_00052 [Fonsecaea erecta]
MHWFSWSFFKSRGANKAPVGSESGPPTLSNLPRSEARPQNGSDTHKAPSNVGANVDDTQTNKSRNEVDKSKEITELAEDMALGRNESLGIPAEIPKQLSAHEDDAGGELIEQRGPAILIPPSDLHHEPESGTPEATDRSQALRALWNQFDHSVDSFTHRLIRAGDLRREAIRIGETAIGQVDALPASAIDDGLRGLRDTLQGLKQVETKLQEEDRKLIQQGFQIVRQGSKIFGPAAETSFQVLNDQGVVMQSRRSATEESIISADDIRLDQTPEARRYLSKQGDVELLEELLINLAAERAMLIDANEPPSVIQELDTRYKELSDKLNQAEEVLARLYDDLPERRVSIPQEQLIEQHSTSRSDIDPEETGSASESQSQRELPGNSLSQILASTTNDHPDPSTTLVKAYLNYQSQQSARGQQDLSEAAEDARAEGCQAQERDPNNLDGNR